MPLKPVFHPFEVRVEECFARAKADGGTRVANVALQIEEEPDGKGSGRAEFLVFDPAGPPCVRSRIISRSNSAKEPSICISTRPARPKCRSSRSAIRISRRRRSKLDEWLRLNATSSSGGGHVGQVSGFDHRRGMRAMVDLGGLRVLEAVAVAVHFENVDVVGQAIEQRAGEFMT